MFGSILSGIRNLFGGGGRDDEEERRRQAANRSRTQATVRQPSTQGGLSMPGQLNETPDRPTVVLPSLRPSASPLEGLSDEDRATAERFQREGKDATAFIQSARNANAAEQRAQWSNSLTGKTAGFVGGLPKATAEVFTEGPRVLGRAAGTGAAYLTGRTRGADEAHRRLIETENRITSNFSRRAQDPNTDPATRARLQAYLQDQANAPEDPAKTQYRQLYSDMAQATDPLTVALAALDTATLPMVGGLTASARAPKALMTAADTIVDPLNVFNRFPASSRVGRLLNTNLIPSRSRQAPSPLPNRTPVRDPESPITTRPTSTPSEPAIKSTNPARLQAPEQPAPAPTPEPAPAPQPAQPLPNLVPEQQLAPEQALPQAPEGPTPEQIRQAEIEQQLAEQAPPPPPEPTAPVAQVLETPDQAQARALAEARPPVGPEAIAQAEASAIRQAQNQARNIGLETPEGAVGQLSGPTLARISDPNAIRPRFTPEEVDTLSNYANHVMRRGRLARLETPQDVRDLNRVISDARDIFSRNNMLDTINDAPRDVDARIANLLEQNEINRAGFRSDGPSPSQMLERNRQLMGDDNFNMVRGRDDVVNGQRVDGYYRDGIVNIVEGKGDLSTVDHEVVHRAFDQFVGPEQRTAILDQIKNGKGFGKTMDDYVKKGYEADPNLIAEEKLADDFMRYAEAKRAGKKIGSLHIPRKILAYFDRVWEGMKSVVGRQDTAKQFYSQLETGKFRNATPLQAPSGTTRLKASGDAPTPQAPKAVAPDPTAALKQEALKYETADEFARAQGEPLYHGGTRQIDKFELQQRNTIGNGMQQVEADSPLIFFTPDEVSARHFANMRGGDSISEARLQPGSKVFDTTDWNAGKNIDEILKVIDKIDPESATMLDEGSLRFHDLIEDPDIIAGLKKQGYDAVRLIEPKSNPTDPLVKTVAVINSEKIQTPKQLTDIYNQAHAEAKAPAPQAPSTPTPKAPKAEAKKTDINSMPDEELTKRFIQLRDYNNFGEISPDELAELDRLTVERMKRRGTYDDQVNEIVDAVNSGTARIEDVPSALREEVGARTNPQTGRVDTPPPSLSSDAQNFGDIVRRSVIDGTINRGDIQDRVTAAAQKAIEDDGGSWDQFIRKYQGAWEQRLPWDKVGFTPAEAEFARRYDNELSTLRDRIDPALRTGGSQPYYSPRQVEGTEYTSELINELSRGSLRNDEIDMSLEPTRQYVERYADAPTAMVNDLVGRIENTIRTGSDPTPTGVKVTEDIKTKLKSDIEGHIQRVDERIKASDLGDADSVSRLTREIDDQLSSIFSDLAGDIRKLPGDSRQAVENLMASRKVYVQSTLRTNMFLNVANRAYDLVPKAFVNAGEKVGLRAALNRAQAKSGAKIYATDKTSWDLANKHSKGALRRDIQSDFRATMAQAGTGANNPLSRILSKADAAYRGAGTAFTSLGDFTGNAVRATNMRILQQAQDAGITGKAELERYLVREMSKPSYQNLLIDIGNQYRGYASLSQVKTAASAGDPKAVQFLSSIDNIVRNKLSGKVPDRAANELNDLFMPPTSGFSGAVSRMATKGANAMTLGQYGYRKGLKMMASDAPGAQEVGQLMMARSILDGVASAGLAATGVTLGAMGHWTGSYPDLDSPNERARWQKDGIKENALAFDVGDKVIYFQPGRILGPLALPLVIPTVAGSAIANGEDITDAVGQVIDGTLSQFVENFGIDAIPQKIGELHDLAQGNSREKAAAVKSFMNSASFAVANAVTPAAGLMNNIGAALDPFERDASGGMVDYIKRRNPFTRQSLDPRTDTLGNPIENRSRISGGSAAITMGAGTSEETSADPVSAEINRLAGAGLETVPARDIKNTNSQEDASLLINTPTYQNASDEEKAEMFKTALLGTKLRDLSQDLDPAHRSAVIEHNLMKNDKRKAWLEDNDNALNYYSGVYHNKEANGTLTVKDRDLDNKDGARYKMVRAEVNKQFGADAELQNLYEKTGLKEWRKLATSNPELYQRLLDYDNARTKGGVSHKSGDSSSNKYYGSASGRGRRGATVNLPSLGGGRSGGGGARSYGNYEEGRRLYNPQVALQAPETVNVPRTPSISVRRGVHI